MISAVQKGTIGTLATRTARHINIFIIIKQVLFGYKTGFCLDLSWSVMISYSAGGLKFQVIPGFSDFFDIPNFPDI